MGDSPGTNMDAGRDIIQGNTVDAGGDAVGRDLIKITNDTYGSQSTPAPSLEQEAQALLDRLPLDHLPEEAPQLSPISRVELDPNPKFVGRTQELCQLAAQLKAGGTVAITTGIGGVGKTQLAIELAHRYGGYFAGGVFWVSFAQPADIAGEVAKCGLRGLVTRPDYAQLKQDEQVEVVRAAWQEPIPRLLIFDNCEDETLLRQWRPKTGACRVLVTSRKQTAWSTVLQVQTLPLEVLPRADSVKLLQQFAPHLKVEEAGAIANELGNLPLALHLAGCYLALYRIPTETYLAKLTGVQLLPHPSLQGRGVETVPTDREPHVEQAFALSLARLDVSKPIDDLARQLLARAACFAPGEPFGRQWLKATITPEGEEEQQQRARTDAVERLLGLGLLESVGEGDLRLHRLLAAYTALALSDADALPAVELVVNRVANAANETGGPQTLLPLLPHLRHCVQRAEGREDEVVASLCANLASYLQAVGVYAEALPFCERSLALRERVLGSEHPDTATSLNNLAALHEAQGFYERALPLYERALALRERALGSDHLDTATSLNNLAALHEAQGFYERALPLYERALALRERVLGSDHPDTATSLNNLAGLHYAQGAYEQALPLLERALALRERALGSDHPDTATSLNNLAVLYEAQGFYERALPLYERALALRERVLGSDHPDTATSLNNLAGLYRAQGAYERALPLYERALAISERMLGANHPQTASSLNNLALLFQAQGAYERALPLYERALAIWERVLGSDHPLTATSLNNLAVLHANQGQVAQALPLLERVIAIRQARLGPRHPDTVQAQRSLAELHRRLAVADSPKAPRATSTPNRSSAQGAGELRRAAALASAHAKVAAVGADPQARADLAARLRTLADRHEQGDPPDPDLAAQLRALAARLTS